jgi:hypothetical protein
VLHRNWVFPFFQQLARLGGLLACCSQ